jgi:hypothetical protein
MQMQRSQELTTTLYFLIGVSAALWVVRPEELFDQKGNTRQMGTGVGQTPVPVWALLLVTSLVFYRNQISDLVDRGIY